MAKTKQEQRAVPQEPLPPESSMQSSPRSAPLPTKPLPPPGRSSGPGLPPAQVGLLPAMELSFNISHGVSRNFSYEWIGPPGLKLLAGRAIVELNDISWHQDASGKLAMVLMVRAGIPTNPEVFEQQLNLIMSERLPTVLTEFLEAESPPEPTVVLPTGIIGNNVWVAAQLLWRSRQFDKDFETLQSTSTTTSGNVLEDLQTQEFINTLRNEVLSSEQLRSIAETARQECLKISIDTYSAELPFSTLLSHLQELTDSCVSETSTQNKAVAAIQLVLDGLAGKSFSDVDTTKQVADNLNACKNAFGLAFYVVGDSNEPLRVNLTARSYERSRTGEFFAKTTKGNKRIGQKPWAVFPALKVGTSDDC